MWQWVGAGYWNVLCKMGSGEWGKGTWPAVSGAANCTCALVSHDPPTTCWLD